MESFPPFIIYPRPTICDFENDWRKCYRFSAAARAITGAALIYQKGKFSGSFMDGWFQ